ncbi:hypothetical protein B0H11DRAFT_1905152 [Mycena galericulata]|nr:hypothetical protein B0H11DRAFT_1905152 [Mycena galericulata]
MPFALLRFVSLAVLAMPSLGQLEFTCFPGDVGAASNCTIFASTFCQTVGTATVSGFDVVSRCFNGPTAGLNCAYYLRQLIDHAAGNLVAKNNVQTVGTPNIANCNNGLATISQECPTGGLGQFIGGTFQFSLDPDPLPCKNTGAYDEDQIYFKRLLSWSFHRNAVAFKSRRILGAIYLRDVGRRRHIHCICQGSRIWGVEILRMGMKSDISTGLIHRGHCSAWQYEFFE